MMKTWTNRFVWLIVASALPWTLEARAQTSAKQPEVKESAVALRLAADIVREGNRLLDEGRFEEALSKYNAAKDQLPEAPEVDYNRGLALYRLGQYREAESAFQDALKPGNPDLEARARYNLGRSAHAAALEKREDLPDAINDLGRAIGFYNDALQIAPTDADTRLNKEAAERLRAYLEKRLQSQPQPEQQERDNDKKDQDDSDEENEQQQDQQQEQDQDQEQEQEQQPSDDQQDSQEGDSEGDQEQEGSEDQGSDQEDNGQQQDQQSQSKDGEQQGQQQPAQDQPPSGAEKEQRMTAEDAEPILQEARDAEKQRREAQRLKMMRLRGRIPADKDW